MKNESRRVGEYNKNESRSDNMRVGEIIWR
jgi:hypothetical protein